MAQPNFQVTLNADPAMMMQAGQAMGGNYMATQQQPTDGTKAPAVAIHYDPSYAKTKQGLLKIVEIVNNLIGMLCIMVSKCSWCSNSNWFNFVASTGTTVTLILLLGYLFHVIERLKFIPWLAIELLYCAVWTFFYMIAALVVAVKGGRDDAWAAAAFFGFVGAILYAMDCYTKYATWKSGTPAQGEKPMTPNYAAY